MKVGDVVEGVGAGTFRIKELLPQHRALLVEVNPDNVEEEGGAITLPLYAIRPPRFRYCAKCNVMMTLRRVRSEYFCDYCRNPIDMTNPSLSWGRALTSDEMSLGYALLQRILHTHGFRYDDEPETAEVLEGAVERLRVFMDADTKAGAEAYFDAFYLRNQFFGRVTD
jgi:hypothetical protein